MNKKKKIIILSVTTVLLATAISVFVFYNTRSQNKGPSLIVSDATVEIGGEVYVNVAINKNPGISGFVVDLEYDKQLLKPIEVVQGDLISQGLFNSNFEPQVNDGILKTTWFDVADIKSDGELFAVKFRVLSSEKTKTPISIKYQEGNIANQSLENVTLNLVDAKVIIK